jgi:L-ascorbate metabolism protein UlaG (beta-lactamase superfamily)
VAVSVDDVTGHTSDMEPRDGITFVGTATVLIRHGGFTVLTDPNFLHRGERARLGMGLRSERLTEPAIQLEELPPLDAIVLSHHHGDHFDDRAAAGLRKDVPIFTTPHAAKKLARQGFVDVTALRPWTSASVDRDHGSLEITALPGKHAPGALQPFVPPVMGSLLRWQGGAQPSQDLYISGDTLLFDGIDAIAERYPEVPLALIHLGGTRIGGVLLTMDADQGAEAIRRLRPRVAIPIHHGDYTVFRDPLENFVRAAASAELPTEIRMVERGETAPLFAPEVRDGHGDQATA